MERKIFKYELGLESEQSIMLPKNAEILTAQEQNGVICLWAVVYPDATPTHRVIEMYGTGHDFPSMGMFERKYISTVQMNGFVWHIFEVL